MPKFIPTKFHQLLADELQLIYENVRDGKDERRVFEMQPQLGKSTMVSELFLAWILGKTDWPVICASYGASLAERKSENCRAIVDSDVYKFIFPKVRLSQESTSREFWRTTKGGTYRAVGVGGALTGMSGRILVCDDPLKDRADANSEVMREAAWNWWNSVFYTRKQSKSAFILVNCLTADTRVLSSSGVWKNINTIRLRGDENKVVSYDMETGKSVIQEVTAVIPQGFAEVYELKTPNQTVKGTARHPFLKNSNGKLEWVELSRLQPGDYIVNLRKFTSGDNTLNYTDEDFWMLGFMLGDGWITNHPNNKGSMRYVTCVAKGIYPELNDRVIQYFKNKFGIELKETKYGYYKTEEIAAAKHFKRMGFKGKAKTKRVPWQIFGMNIQLRESFLNGFLAADGHESKTGLRYVGLCNKLLVEDIQLLAISIGYKTSNIFSQSFMAQPPHSPKPFLAHKYSISIGFNKHMAAPFGLVKVESIKKLPKKERVYDLSVKGSENFIANGLVVHNTRWHMQDVAGHLEEQQAAAEEKHGKNGAFDKWEKMTFPAIAEEDEYIHGKLFRKAGEVLAPERFSLDDMERTKNAYMATPGGISEWAALYMQTPIVNENAEFRRGWFKYYTADKLVGKKLYYTTFVDLAISQKKSADHTVVRTVAKEVDGPNWYLMEETAGIMDPLQTIDAIFHHYDLYRSKIYIESVGYQTALQYFVIKEQRERNIFFSVEEIKPGRVTRKEERIRGLIPLYRAGVIWHRKGEDDALETELLQFPKGRRDDRIDALSYGLQAVRHAPRQAEETQDGRLNWKKKKPVENFNSHTPFNKV